MWLWTEFFRFAERKNAVKSFSLRRVAVHESLSFETAWIIELENFGLQKWAEFKAITFRICLVIRLSERQQEERIRDGFIDRRVHKIFRLLPWPLNIVIDLCLRAKLALQLEEIIAQQQKNNNWIQHLGHITSSTWSKFEFHRIRFFKFLVKAKNERWRITLYNQLYRTDKKK